MTFIPSWEEFEKSAELLYLRDPMNTRYSLKYSHSKGVFIVKITDNKKCLQYKTEVQQDGEVEIRISTGINEDQPSEKSRQLQQLNQDQNHDLEGVENENHDFVVQSPSLERDEDDFLNRTEYSVHSQLEGDTERSDHSDRQDDFYKAEDDGHEQLMDIQEPRYFLRDRKTLRCPERYNDCLFCRVFP
ncbi:hypothetical protein K1T71_005091 [Dendrolimus kikuchii]|uniref:Uncharacterized protein n=1 Tax=Dendrolimus kikuchii TaxID=765133 RepID=A0ACC1D6M2_9NEOP|nr:hypothetical protein K1T71_005091 [Dendrolimus kikuchii]